MCGLEACLFLTEKRYCSLCHRSEAIHMRKYSGERLCRRCFIKTFERRVAKTISEYDMFHYDDRIVVAVSGGKDSLSLMDLLARIESLHPYSELIAVTVDEGISGYRDEAVEIARVQARNRGVEHVVVSFKDQFGYMLDEMVAVLKGRGSETYPCTICGVLRRRSLSQAAREAGADVVATAHTLDDVVQTYILNIMRGDLAKPWAGRVKNQLIPRVTPFRLTPEKEAALYAYLRGMYLQTHACKYASTSSRNLIRFFLNDFEAKYPGSLFTALRSLERMPLRDKTAVSMKCRICGELSSREMCRACEILGTVSGKVGKTPSHRRRLDSFVK
ncbi:MAG: TIGR00269 family protein [Nitrososphaeria archaeon]